MLCTIAQLEKSGVLTILTFFGRNGGKGLKEWFQPPMLRMTQEALDSVVATLVRCGLIVEKASDLFPDKMMFETTPRGQLVATHLLEIEKLLMNRKPIPGEKLAQVTVSLEDLPGYVAAGRDEKYEERMKEIQDRASGEVRKSFEAAKRRIRKPEK